jgi:hypothetical protein
MELDIRRFEAHIDMNSPASARFGERIKAVEKGSPTLVNSRRPLSTGSD